MSTLKLTLVLSVITTAPLALAQSQHQASSARPLPRTAPAQPVSTQLLMQSSGGSLLQASMPQHIEPLNSKTPSYSLYAVPEPEPKIIKKHALVNIIVREESQSASKGITDLKKIANIDAKVDSFVKFDPATFSILGRALDNPPEVKMSGTRNYKGDATANRTDSVVARIEAEVIDVKPNGTLVLQARKRIKSEDEEQQIILTGVCRVEDVDASNSVLSTDLHDLDLQKITKGAVRDTTRRGLLPRLLDFINPF